MQEDKKITLCASGMLAESTDASATVGYCTTAIAPGTADSGAYYANNHSIVTTQPTYTPINQCPDNHAVELKVIKNQIITYCSKCGKILDVKDMSKDYMCIGSLSQIQGTGNTATLTI